MGGWWLLTRQIYEPGLRKGTDGFYDDFSECECCRKIYWPGSHWGEMQGLISRIMERLR